MISGSWFAFMSDRCRVSRDVMLFLKNDPQQHTCRPPESLFLFPFYLGVVVPKEDVILSTFYLYTFIIGELAPIQSDDNSMLTSRMLDQLE